MDPCTKCDCPNYEEDPDNPQVCRNPGCGHTKMEHYVSIDVTTRNVDLRIINEEWGKYPAGSEASVAIWKIKERLSQ